ncbi:hypothetical protein HID58_087242 [Brassica napus]|uniref:Uncharacterized protein n=1 Tax=Brassica napus TaxID=3708 RepID=A0ABQ7XSY8_BRANA|nr:hypothetical protein HID58_087242 [Brassica napus]
MEDFLELEEFLELENGENLEYWDIDKEITMEDFLELEEWFDPEQKLDDERNTMRKDLETSSKASIDRHQHDEIVRHSPHIINQHPPYIIVHPSLDELPVYIVELEPVVVPCTVVEAEFPIPPDRSVHLGSPYQKFSISRRKGGDPGTGPGKLHSGEPGLLLAGILGTGVPSSGDPEACVMPGAGHRSSNPAIPDVSRPVSFAGEAVAKLVMGIPRRFRWVTFLDSVLFCFSCMYTLFALGNTVRSSVSIIYDEYQKVKTRKRHLSYTPPPRLARAALSAGGLSSISSTSAENIMPNWDLLVDTHRRLTSEAPLLRGQVQDMMACRDLLIQQVRASARW